MASSTDEEDARMLLDILSPINNVINDRFTLKLVDIFFYCPTKISIQESVRFPASFVCLSFPVFFCTLPLLSSY